MRIQRKELEFQNKAANIAIDYLLKQQKFSFKSPTGSGKTLITGMMIEKYLSNPVLSTKKTTFIFIAPSVGALDYQGYQKISGYLDKGWISGFYTEYIGTGDTKSKNKYLQNIDKFKENTIYFIGWSLFGKNSNLTNIDSERNNLFRVIENTKYDNTNIVLIIDEAHRELKNITSETKKAALDAISPIKRIEISATLDDPDHEISLKEVREEAAIKKNVIVNTGQMKEYDLESQNEIEQLISAAIKKQKEVINAYFKRNISNKPLILIQIPDKRTIDGINTDDYYLTRVQNTLDKKGYKEGSNYAIWLSDNKTIKDKKALIENDSPIEILIFKQAIATGWDLPRANILIRLREPKSPKFDIQTLGRILRNPFFKYYDNELIDNAFVFTKDKKYTSKILNEKYISAEGSFVSFDKSDKSKKSTLKLNKILFKNDIDDDQLIKYIANKATNKIKDVFTEKGQQSIKEYFNNIDSIPNFKLNIADIDNKNKVLEQSNVRRSQQSSWNFQKTKDDLFTIFLKYKFVFGNKFIESKAMDKIAENLSPSIKKKDFYKFIVTGYSNTYIKYGNKNIIEYLQYIKNKYIKENSGMYTEEFSLPEKFLYSTKFGTTGWDKLNSYKLFSNPKGLDSDIERSFWKEIKSEFKNDDDVHFFRNGIGPDSFKIEYFNTYAKKSKFFPDFLLIDEKNKKVVIIDTKGRNEKDIDKESDNKFNSAWEHISDIKNNYKVSVAKITCQEDDKWEFKKAKDDDNIPIVNEDFSMLLK